eukprot:CAMPEP_0170648164 /NCGR_PEP_ID=MMETSP0224-20130122/44593_1 /TAXON_ID=285029 /ORGANISM="Togula jolla, Strain CCCM 725" /LENGTH=139 /DNA_ID=CAMNT_0010979681 /DNA_START=13 /DNA_END=432 /DNA_ORIENTATION=+
MPPMPRTPYADAYALAHMPLASKLSQLGQAATRTPQSKNSTPQSQAVADAALAPLEATVHAVHADQKVGQAALVAHSAQVDHRNEERTSRIANTPRQTHPLSEHQGDIAIAHQLHLHEPLLAHMPSMPPTPSTQPMLIR